jgi:hypothetical protein
MSSDNQVGTSNGDHKKNVEKNNVNRVRRIMEARKKII